MSVFQKEILLSPKSKGFHLITSEVLNAIPGLSDIKAGMLFLNLQHTSASIMLNECADPEVRVDMETFFNKTVPENAPWYIHTYEGSDDMPAHIKSAIIGTELSLPITNGKLNLGTWQGIYLGEHRNSGGRRRIIATIMG